MGNRTRIAIKSLKSLYADTTNCTDAVIETLCENIYIGMPISGACALARISEKAFYTWMDKGSKFLNAAEDEEMPPSWEQYAEMYLAVTQAQAGWQRKKLYQSLDCEKYNPNWSRDLTMLGIKDRANWGTGQSFVPSAFNSDGNDDKFL